MSAVTNSDDRARVDTLEMVFSYKNGKTILSHVYAKTPFKITRLYYPEESSLAQLIIMHMSPGLFGGDHIVLNVRVEAGARIMLNSQSSPKIHPSRGLLAKQNSLFDVHSEGELHYYNEPVIPFAQSRLQQKIEIHVEPEARFYYWDGIMSGRVLKADGLPKEQWLFTELSFETRLHEDQDLLYLDRFNLFPEQKDMTQPWIMQDYHYLGTALVYDQGLTTPLCEAFQQTLFSDISTISGSVDLLTDSLLSCRILAKEGISFQKTHHLFSQFLFEKLLNEPHIQVRK